MINKNIILVLLLFISACGAGGIKYGEVSKIGVVRYKLCERAQYRITDLKRVSFMMPKVFIDNCSEKSKYTIFVQEDHLNTSISGEVISGNKMIVGGTLGVEITARDYKKKWHYYSNPELMLEDYASIIYQVWPWYQLAVEYSWVERAGMRCLRLPVESDNGLLRSRRMDYFCWETVSGYPYPIHLHAWERLPSGSTGGTDFEKVLIEPILDSMQINPADPEILAQYKSKREQMCRDSKLFYDTSGAQGQFLGGDIDMRRTVRFLKDCGHDIAYLPKVESLYDLITIKGEVIGTPGSQEHISVFDDFLYADKNTYLNYGQGTFLKDVRLLSEYEFKELKDILLKLRPRVINTPFYYPGNWYGLSPSYERRPKDGFGIREHAQYGTVIDMTGLLLGHPRLSFIVGNEL